MTPQQELQALIDALWQELISKYPDASEWRHGLCEVQTTAKEWRN